MPKNEIFILTHDHLKLLRRACVWWDGTEAGAPGIDPKRPYGDGDVPRSMAEILKIDPLGMEDDEPCLTKEQTEAAWQLHMETSIALQLLLLGFTKPGVYEHYDYGCRSWRRVEG